MQDLSVSWKIIEHTLFYVISMKWFLLNIVFAIFIEYDKLASNLSKTISR